MNYPLKFSTVKCYTVILRHSVENNNIEYVLYIYLTKLMNELVKL